MQKKMISALFIYRPSAGPLSDYRRLIKNLYRWTAEKEASCGCSLKRPAPSEIYHRKRICMDLHRLYPRGLTELTLRSVLVLVNSATSAVARCNGCLRVSEAIPSLLLSDKMLRLVQAVLRTVGRRGAGWRLRSLQLNSAQCSLLFCCS